MKNNAGRLFFYRNHIRVLEAFLLIVGEEDNEVLTIEFANGIEQGYMKHYMRKHMDPWFNDHPGWIEVGA
jgi:hypothetical protein